MGLNIPEILVADGTGIIMVTFLLLFRMRKQQLSQVHERIFSCVLVLSLIALTGEMVSFLIDGRTFPGCFFLQYVCNFFCVGLVVVVGFLWCLFVDYRIYCNKKRLKYKAAALCAPLLLLVTLLLSDLFGTGIIFTVDSENRYARGRFSILTYVLVFIYFMESIINAHRARKKGIVPFFFPIYCFVVPCMVGTMIQALFYGISTGWLATSIAAVFVYMELQTSNYYMDELSGLFNRQYMNYYLSQTAQQNSKIYGVLLDIDDFKLINDIHGHSAGDRAIHCMGRILVQSMHHNAVAMRMGGDEFVIFLADSSERECQKQMESIQNQIERFNKGGNEPFQLSVSMGSACFDGASVENFLAEMDAAMYERKRDYHCSKELQYEQKQSN